MFWGGCKIALGFEVSQYTPILASPEDERSFSVAAAALQNCAQMF